MASQRKPTELERITAIAATDALVDALQQARQDLAAQAIESQVYSIPMLTDDMAPEDSPTGPITVCTGETGIHEGLQALCRTDYADHQHPRGTLRRPGLIRVQNDCADLVESINRRKLELRVAMQPFHYSAWREWRESIPSWTHFCRLQAYREWHWVAKPLHRFGLGWAGNSTGTEYLRIAALMGRLLDQRNNGGHERIDAELDRLSGFDENEVVAINRPIAPTPMVNLRYTDGAKQVLKTAAPVLVSQPLPRITPLRDFAASQRNERRKDVATEGEPLVAHWHAYRFLAPYRFHLRDNPTPARLRWRDGMVEIRSGRAKAPAEVIPAPSTGAVAALVDEANRTKGGAQGGHTLDAAGDVALVGANRLNAFFDAGALGVWRVPITDLRALVRAMAA